MLDRLDEAIQRAASKQGSQATSVPRQTVACYDQRDGCVDMTYEVMLCVVAAGEKTPVDGTHEKLSAGDALLSLSTVPVVASITPPYRSVTALIDLERVAAIDETMPSATARPAARGELITRASHELIDAVSRWVELASTPWDIPVLAERYEDEILYRLLQSPVGPHLRYATASLRHDPIPRVTAHIAREFNDSSLCVDDLVRVSGMSRSAFHRQFKDRTGVTPNHYVRRVRLQHARRLLLMGETAALTASMVGYVSASHFSRDYAEYYGIAPRRHAREHRPV